MASTAHSRRHPPNRPQELPPFPEGWYFVARRRSLGRAGLLERTWMGEEIVVWADGDGRVCVADAFCPHLGSHMGPTVGGKVRDGCLVCPFHGFEFDAAGTCVATPNAPPPKAARLRIYETAEMHGMIFAWWGSGGRPPQWELPEAPPAGREWSGLRFCTVRFRGHPQETTENGVDLDHLGYTHGYRDVRAAGHVVDGAYLRSAFDFRIERKVAGLTAMTMEISAVTHVHGLGFSLVEFHESKVGMNARLWVLATPVDDATMELVLAAQVREMRSPGRFFAGLRFLPVPLRHRAMNLFVLREEKRYVLQDVAIWSRKKYVVPPRLSRSDGPVGKYRRYCRQFYPGVP